MKAPHNDYLLYLKEIRKINIIIILFRILIITIFFIGWQLLSDLNIINNFLTSSPIKIIKTILLLLKNGDLINHITYTLFEIIVTFIISFSLSFTVSILMWYYPIFSKVIDPYLTVLNSLPKVALGPLIIIWAGSGTSSIIIMGLLISVFVTTINLYTYFSTTDSNYINLMNTFYSSRINILKKVVIPSNYSNIISSMKVNISMNYIGIIMGELLVSKKGLGYLITYGSSVFNINLVLTSIAILCFLSYCMYFLIEYINKKISSF